MMLARQRQQVILDEVTSRGAVKVVDLGATLGVSDMTIRRDINELVEQGLVERVHGGVTLPRSASVHEPGFSAKSELDRDAKRAIARAAARLVRPGTSVGISGGTTTHALARELLDVPDITVVTNSLPVADAFHEGGRDDQTILLTGGQRTPSFALVGPLTVAALRGIHVDMLFLGTHGMGIDSGLTCPNLMEAQTNQALVASSRRVVVLADHTKWGVTALANTIPLSDVDILITDAGLERTAQEALADHVGDLVVTRENREGPTDDRA
ncbi:DeoR/GlpR family DNA-binding transcription regulator [Rhodococcus opacus]|uniref:DeoR/GlpR family DNA-binding transcription regulator n=1 Tax=Rhodococcus opacus TaxID=37919 RepID=UPI002474F3DD|nr:DeoR/GlpR family DNA-binding transcription regulator [Rhodococcus opacus]MDH6287912.1 DeoR/GlpR family transcriptional regulator of sugar metabolism [Rhodococcus opacus]